MITVLNSNIKSIADNEIEKYTKLLPESMQKNIQRYRHPPDKKFRLISRLMLLSILKKENKVHLINNWEEDQNRKPFIKDWYYFNISHSGEQVTFVYSTNIIGIDIEKIQEDMDYSEILKNFQDKEQAYILNSQNPIHSFYEIWVKKEATLKAMGYGILNGLKEFNCMGNEIEQDNKKWFLTPVTISNNYMCYISSSASEKDYHLIPFSLEELIH